MSVFNRSKEIDEKIINKYQNCTKRVNEFIRLDQVCENKSTNEIINEGKNIQELTTQSLNRALNVVLKTEEIGTNINKLSNTMNN